MRLGLQLGLAGPDFSIDMNLIHEAEALGFDSVWTGEAYGSDAITPITWVLANTNRIKAGTAIMQMPGRTPAMAAMTAITLQALSGNRFIMGVGPSGPQVVEGWHGVPYGKPLTRTKEYISIVRQIIARREPMEFQGEYYQLPYFGDDATGLGKPLKSIIKGDPSLKIYTAAIGPSGLKTSAEVADGVFPFFSDPENFDVFDQPLREGFAKAGNGKSLDDFEILPLVQVTIGEDLEACRLPTKQFLALYGGGMGARGKNFYNDHIKRLGFEEAAVKIQDLYLGGRKGAAIGAVPDELVDRVALVGSKARVRDRLGAWKEAAARKHVGTMVVPVSNVETLRFLAEELL